MRRRVFTVNRDTQEYSGSNEFAEWEEKRRTQALMYLHEKYPEEEEAVFFTDSTGRVSDRLTSFLAVAQAGEIEEMCGKCKGGECVLPEDVKRENSRPLISVSESPRGFRYLEVRWTCGLSCKYEEADFKRKLKKSGVKTMQQTFENYECTPSNPEMTKVKKEAMEASEAGRNLILAGNPGTGKTHLAVAIALRVMEKGRQALFRLVSAMLDEIQSAIRDGGDYDGLMRKFKTVPCLVLDDLGHENMTAARGSYLHQIIDYRYVYRLQTVITTNAKSIEELCDWDKEEYIKPIVSRVLERGKWVLIEDVEDYRKKRGACNGV